MIEANRQAILDVVVRLLADRRLDSSQVLGALTALADRGLPPAAISDLSRLLDQTDDPSVDPLRLVVRRARVAFAIKAHGLRKRGESIPEEVRRELSDLPAEVGGAWLQREASVESLRRGLLLVRDRRYLTFRRAAGSAIAAQVDRALAEAAAETVAGSSVWRSLSPRALVQALEARADVGNALKNRLRALDTQLERQEEAQRQLAAQVLALGRTTLPAGMDERIFLDALVERFQRAESHEERRRLLDSAACWPTDQVAFVLDKLCTTVWAQDRVTLILSLRFGEPYLTDWSKWSGFLTNYRRVLDENIRVCDAGLQRAPEAVLAVWCMTPECPDAELRVELDALGSARPPDVDADSFVMRWRNAISAADANRLLDLMPPPLPNVMAKPPLQGVAAVPPPPLPQGSEAFPVAASESREEAPASSAWSWLPQVRAFLVENWYLALGLVMILVGCSVLAFYTWDKHWLVRHALMPGLLAAITVGLAWAGGRLERLAERFIGTAAVFRGAAIALLPANFISVALLVDDPMVPHKTAVTFCMALVYAGGFGWGLKRWCGAVHPPLGRLLGIPLLLLNLLVLMRPAALAVGLGAAQLPQIFQGGFYAGLLLTAFVVLAVGRGAVLSKDIVAERRVPWFLGTTLIVSFLEILAWVYGSAGIVPEPAMYAPMVVLAAGLILYIERRMQEIEGVPGELSGESFLGFGVLLLGVFMGLQEPAIRVAVLFLGGAVWMVHAWRQSQRLHYGIGLVLISAGGAAAGFLPEFPARAWPAIGLGMAVLMEGFALAGQRSGRGGLVESAVALQVAWLLQVVLCATWEPWGSHTRSLLSAGYLAGVVAVLGYRAVRDGAARWIHMAMAVLVMIGPCADPRWFPVTTVMAAAVVAWVWMVLATVANRPVLRSTRSTVAVFYAGLALILMAYRMLSGSFGVGEMTAWLKAMSFLGPVLMMLVLIPAAFYTRSAVPAWMGVGLLAMVLSESVPLFRETVPWLRPGSGLFTSFLSLGLLGLISGLARLRWPAGSGPVDPFFGGIAFPAQRSDASLFMRPLLGVVIFLTVQMETLTLWTTIDHDGFDWRTAVALALTGVAWTWAGVLERCSRRSAALAAVHLGWIWVLVALLLGEHFLAADPDWVRPVLAAGVILQALYFVYWRLERVYSWVGDLLKKPMQDVLDYGSIGMTVISILALVDGMAVRRLVPLMAFLAAQHVWHALRGRRWAHGACLFGLVWVGLLAASGPGAGAFAERLTFQDGLNSTLWLLLAIQGAALLAEVAGCAAFVRPLLLPSLWMGGVVAIGMACVCAIDALGAASFTAWQQAGLLAALVLTARALHLGPAALAGALLGYVLAHGGAFRALDAESARVAELFVPWHVSLLALAMTAGAAGGRFLHQRYPAWMSGAFAPTGSWRCVTPWLLVPAIASALAGVILMMSDPGFRLATGQVGTPFLSGLAFLAIAAVWKLPGTLTAGVGLVMLGNVMAVHILAGPWLLERGLTGVHLTNLGLAAGLLELSLARLLMRGPAVNRYVSRISLLLSSMILIFIVALYFSCPDLRLISGARFAVSGVMAYLAGWYFRRVSRDGAAEFPFDVTESAYHFGVTLALWCAALTIPWFRTSATALWALAVPLFYFCARAELDLAAGRPSGTVYRTSATALGLLVLAIYVFRLAFQMVLFPGAPVRMDDYHAQAPLLLLVGPLLLRLRGLGGLPWLAFIGGATLMTGSYFTLTAWPAWRPETAPTAAAWCAVALGHFWALVSHQRSPVRTLILKMTAMDVREWMAQRHAWGILMLGGVHMALLWAIVSALIGRTTLSIAPLMLGGASLFMHLGAIRGSRLYFILGGVELMTALHMDFFVPSHLAAEQVVWVVLGLWAALLAVHAVASALIRERAATALAVCCFIVTMGHVFWHDPRSVAGLAIVAVLGLLAVLTPVSGRVAEAAGSRIAVGGLLWIPTWLTLFGLWPTEVAAPELAKHPWPVLMATLVMVGTGFAAEFAGRRLGGLRAWGGERQARLGDQVMDWLAGNGGVARLAVLVLGLCVLVPAFPLQFGLRFEIRESALLALLGGVCAAGWYLESRVRNALGCTVAGQVCFAGAVASARAAVVAAFPGLWRAEYDIWLSLALSTSFVMMRQFTVQRGREMSMPFTVAIMIIPAMSLVWSAMHHLGVNMAMLIVFVQSLLWIWMGKDERQSPFHGLAVGGFVAVVLMFFWSHLALRTLHAYVIPVGVGLLMLVHLFREQVLPETRNLIRTVVLTAMLGSVGYQLLMRTHHSLGFHVTLLGLGLFAMGFGGWLRVRVYLYLGAVAVLVDLAAVVVDTFTRMERNIQMTLIGLTVLLLGAAFVGGAIYYKTRRATIQAAMDSWRRRLGGWE